MNDLELAEEVGRNPCRVFTADELKQIIAALRRGHGPKRAMIDDVPLCAGHADWWFTSRNHLKGDTSCVVCAFNPERPPSGEMVMVPRELIARAVLWFHTFAENGMDATFSDGERTPNAVAMDEIAAQFSTLSAAEASKEAK